MRKSENSYVRVIRRPRISTSVEFGTGYTKIWPKFMTLHCCNTEYLQHGGNNYSVLYCTDVNVVL